jgi:hypothetical protein
MTPACNRQQAKHMAFKKWDYVGAKRNWEVSLSVPIGAIRGPIGDLEVSVVD